MFKGHLSGVRRLFRTHSHRNVADDVDAEAFGFVDESEVRVARQATMNLQKIYADFLQRPSDAAGLVRIPRHHLILIETLAVENRPDTKNAWADEHSRSDPRAPVVDFG